MKNRITLFLLAVLLCAVSYSQENPNRNRIVDSSTIARIMRQRQNAESANVPQQPVAEEPAVDAALVPVTKIGRNFINAGYSYMDMELPGMSPLKNYFGATFGVGHSYFFNRKPLGGFLHLGLDVMWLDLNYNNYRLDYVYSASVEELEYHQGEAAMQIGPSATMNFAKDLNIHAYARYAPSFSALYADDTFYSAFANYFVAGASLSYKFIGLGFDYRFGECEYKDYISISADPAFNDEKTKHTGWRFYMTFRF